MKRTGKRKALPKGSCDVCGPQPGEEMSLHSASLCWRHCPHPLRIEPTRIWTPDSQSNHHMRTSWGVVHSHGNGKALDRAKSASGKHNV